MKNIREKCTIGKLYDLLFEKELMLKEIKTLLDNNPGCLTKIFDSRFGTEIPSLNLLKEAASLEGKLPVLKLLFENLSDPYSVAFKMFNEFIEYEKYGQIDCLLAALPDLTQVANEEGNTELYMVASHSNYNPISILDQAYNSIVNSIIKTQQEKIPVWQVLKDLDASVEHREGFEKLIIERSKVLLDYMHVSLARIVDQYLVRKDFDIHPMTIHLIEDDIAATPVIQEIENPMISCVIGNINFPIYSDADWA